MANKELVEYLKQYKDKYPIEALKAELRKSGYTDAEIKEAEAQVLGAAPPPRAPVSNKPYLSNQTASSTTEGLAGKSFMWYFEIAKMPVIVVIIYAGAMWLFKLIPIINIIFLFLDVFSGWIVSLGAAIFLGYTAVKKYKASLIQALIAGAIGGIGAGIAKALFDTLFLLTSGKLAGTVVGLLSLIWIPLGEATIWLIVAVIVAALLGAGKKNE
jgi:hypothetical protein